MDKLVELQMLQPKSQEEIEIGPDALSIDLLRAVYRANHLPLTTRMRAAMACLKHEVPALLATAIVNEGDFAELLDRRLKRIEEMKLIEAKPTTNSEPATNGHPQLEPQPNPPPRIWDKRYRRL